MPHNATGVTVAVKHVVLLVGVRWTWVFLDYLSKEFEDTGVVKCG